MIPFCRGKEAVVMKPLRVTGIFLLILAFGALAPLAAQVRVELGFGWSLVTPLVSASYTNEFSPPYSPGSYTSSASQTLHVNGKTSLGMGGFLNIMFGERLGVQVLADYSRPSLGGTNSDYNLLLNYETYEPRTYETHDAWPATSGSLTQTTFSLNGLLRFPLASDLAFSASAGWSVSNFDGKAAPIGFSRFWLEQDGTTYTLYRRTLRMIYAFGPDTVHGLNAGGEMAYTFMRSVILAVDVRYFYFPRRDLQLSIVDDPILSPETVQGIEDVIQPGTLRVDPSFFRVNLILRFRF
jgi:hypothetical protein